MSESDSDTTRTTVRTYVPASQREEWDAHAEELDMSRSEFVKTMVQAGRRGFEGGPRPESEPEVPTTDTSTQNSAGQQDLEQTVLDALSTDEHLSWDELLAAVTDDIETRLEETLQKLQSDDQIRYSGRHGGYTLES